MQQTSRVGAGNFLSVRFLYCSNLSITQIGSYLRVEGGIRTTGTTAKTIVVQRHCFDISTQNFVYRFMTTLNVPQMARVLHHNSRGKPAFLGKIVEMLSQPFVNVENPLTEPSCRVGAQKMPIVFELGSAACGIYKNRSGARKCLHRSQS